VLFITINMDEDSSLKDQKPAINFSTVKLVKITSSVVLLACRIPL
jgi:hypothetical protein